MDSPDSEVGDAFSEGIILPPLIIQLRKILDQYPDDSQIFKELLQNAEDAGAREVKFLYDRKKYGTNPRYLHHQGLSKHQDYSGPALYAYNDALFNEADWKGVRMLSQSVKQNDPLKVGYFGMGFKSVFHLTDIPFVLSGDHLGVIDPHQKFFPSSSHGWNLSKGENLLESLPHQFEPFTSAFDCTRDTFKEGFYNGTLFRFPLRTQQSALSDVLYTEEKVQGLLETFKEDAHLLLLFLRQVDSIEVYQRDAHSQTPKLLFKVQVSEECREEVRQQRREFLNHVSLEGFLDKPLVSTYPIIIETTSLVNRQEVHKSYKWLVTNYFVGGQASSVFRRLQRDSDLSYPPWVGTALPLSWPDAEESEESDNSSSRMDGHVFCALPLPADQGSQTGLPIHVNGYFALEQNRKYIKWPTSASYRSREDLMDKRLLWNQCMLKEAIPKAYSRMLKAAINLYKQGLDSDLTLDKIYNAFPNLSIVDRKWNSMLPSMYSELFSDPVIYTAARGGLWIPVKEAIFDTLDAGEEAREVILQILAEADIKVASVPQHVQEAIRVCCMISLGKMTPNIISTSYKEIQHNITLPWEAKMKLLRFFLKQNRYDLLDGLELVPLANGGFNVFFHHAKRADRPIYIADSKELQELFPGMEDDFLDQEMDNDIKDMLVKAASRGYTQLKNVDNNLLGDLLCKALPSNWFEGNVVFWTPGENGHPPHTWLESLWTYLVSHCPRNLQCIERVPCVPVGAFTPSSTEVQLLPLASDRVLMMRQMDGLCLGEGLEDILGEIGVYVVQDLPDFIKIHPLVSRAYIFSPSYIGVIKALEKLTDLNGPGYVSSSLENLEDDDRRKLRRLFAKVSEYELTAEHRDILSKLPLFETVKGSGGKESQFVSFSDVNLTAPAEQLPVSVSRPLLELRDTHSVNLARVLGVKELSVVQLLMQVIFPDIESMEYETEDVEKLMIYILKQYHFFVSQDEKFQDTLKGLPFLPRKDILLTPDRFYDPDSELLQEMFYGEDNFPSGAYAEPSMVAILGEIGLRGVLDVEPEDLLESAYQIGDLMNASEPEMRAITAKSDAILHYVCKHPKILEADCQGDPLKEALQSVVWVRRLKTKPNFYPKCLSWFEGETFYKPQEMVCRKFAHLVGSVMPTVAMDISEDVQQGFGWSSSPPLDSIVQHLKSAVQAFDGKEKAAFVETVDNIYSVLSNHNVEEVREHLQEKGVTHWIWHGEGFASPDNVFFQEAFMDLTPYVYCIPWELRQHHGLFIDMGVSDNCDLSEILRMIKERNEKEEYSSDSTIKRDLHLSVSILNELKSHITDEMLSELQQKLYLPVHDSNTNALRMAPLLECTYSDMEWIRQGYDLNDLQEESSEHFFLVHPNVPVSTSEALGVPTLMSRMLDAEELDFSFGQTDSLTHRLNVLLQEYTDGFAVPKELVQNADDAGATEVKFLYDERQNTDAMSCLIDEGMRECHGPALWAFNNAVFTDDDFENITKLSGATKENQTDKIGRFGLGFNAVYNLTDVPSFVSRHNIVIFDPHTTHLGKNIKNKAKPGIKIDVRKHRRKLRRLGNQFKPYNDVFGCDLRPDARQESYPGTLFRFPLRTRTQAIRSEICQKHYDDAEVKLLLNMLIKGAENLLLFTQNIVKVSVYHLSPKAKSALEMGELFSVEKSPVHILRELTPQISLPPSANDLPGPVQQLIQNCSSLKASTACMNDLRHGADIQTMNRPDSSILFDLKTFVSTEGEVLLDQARSHHTQPWLVTSYMGQGEVLKMALQEDNLLPTAGVAVPLKKVYDDLYEPLPIWSIERDAKHDGTVFTYLPLPVHSGLPVHINAPFAVTASRRHLCEKTEDDKFDLRAIWNNALMTEPVCQAYLRLLMDLSELTRGTEYQCYDLWPRAEFVESASSPVLSTFYKMVALDNNGIPMEVFSDGKKWGSIHEAHFLDPDYLNSDVGMTALRTFRECTSESSDLVADLPMWAFSGFEEADVLDIIHEQTFTTEKFFDEVLMPNIHEIDEDNRNSLVLDALERREEPILNIIKEYPCIPATPNGEELKKASELVHPKSMAASLFNHSDSRFPYGLAFDNESCLQVLVELGMAAETLPWEDILERAETIQGIDYSEAKQRIPSLLSFINNKVAIEGDDGDEAQHCKERLLDLPLLPVMQKPHWFPVEWNSDSHASDEFLKPSELFPPEQSNLICCVSLAADPSVFPSDSDHVKSFLDMKEVEPNVDLVLSQLDMVTGPEAEEALADKSVNRDMTVCCHAIYTFLQDRCHNKKTLKKIGNHLAQKKFILCKDRYLSPEMVALEFPYSCAPYLQGLSEQLKTNFGTLMNAAGVKEHFETPDYVLALQHIHDDYPGEVLGRDLLKLALQIVNLLNDSMEEMDQTLTQVVEDYGTIYIPDANNVLQSASDLCFNEPECNWLPAASQQGSYSHPLIPFAISKQLGVNTKRQEVLKKHSRGIPFGQRERLTNRLKRILSSYPCDKEILKEMLQNADDSGATEIHFIKDPRKHGKDRVFEESWKPLQGPALCVYNNRPFTEADIEGIQHLGEGSKGSDPNKTGQYGVGFNCVYHLTDAPSFLTKGEDIGETLCVFDPHGKYVPGASIDEPGRRYDDVAALRNIFTDVFPCYLEDKFSLDNATMFRFPLRNAEMASDSELSDQVVDVDTVDTLFSKFRSECFDCLLFLNNVATLGLFEIDQFTKRCTNTYKVTAQVERGADERDRFAEHIKAITKKLKRGMGNVWNVSVKDVTYSLDISDSQGRWEKWLVTQQVGFSGRCKPSRRLMEAFRRGELALLPRGGVAALIDASDPTGHRQKRAFCFLPLPVKTELPVHINGHFALESEARRNIWLDSDSGPKADWNTMLMQDVIAPCYVTLLQQIPQYLGSSHVDPNLSMMEMSGEDVPNMDLFGDLFPRFNQGTDPWTSLTVAVYEHIHQIQAPVLPIARPSTSFYSMSRSNLALNSVELKDQAEIEWLSTSGVNGCRPYFDNLDFYIADEEDLAFSGIATRRKIATSTPKKKPSKVTLRQVLLSSGFKLITLPMAVYESFIAAGVEVECVSPSVAVDFFKSYGTDNQLCTIGTLPCDIYDTAFQKEATLLVVLEYCAKESYYFQSNLEGLPLLLTEDNQLRQFDSSEPVFLTPYNDLLPGLQSVFVHHLLARSVLKEADIEDCKVFKPFDIQAFASLLLNVLPKEKYMTCTEHVEWPLDEVSLPNPQWIWMLWSFIKQEYDKLVVENSDDLDEHQLACTLLNPLKDWCLLPVVVRHPTKKVSKASQSYSYTEFENSDQYLVPIRAASTAIDYSQASIMSYPARECLRKMKIPELNTRMLDGGQLSPVGKGAAAASTNSSLAKVLVASLERPKSVLYALEMAIDLLGKNNLSLKVEDCFLICKYYSEAANSWSKDYDTQVILRKLPLFPTLAGSLTKLERNEVFTLPSEIPKTDMQAWESQNSILFIVHQNGLADLYEALNCKVLSLTEGYTKYIFKHFEYLSRESQEEHLKFIKDTKLPHLPDAEKEAIVEGLRDLEFLKDEDGFMRKASEFYDPYHPVFKAMLEPGSSSFPPVPYCEFKWLDFMRKIGLQHDVTAEMFIHFANQVAYEAKSDPSEETFNKARTLITHLFKVRNLPTEHLLEQLVDIQFIPAAKVNTTMQRIHAAHGKKPDGSYRYISFKEGIPESHEVLVWTSSYLLPDWANPWKLTETDVNFAYPKESSLSSLQDYQNEIAKILKIQEHPDIAVVVQHIQNICKTQAPKNSQIDDLQAFMKIDVMKRVYRYLQGRIEDAPSDETLRQLESIGEIPCIVTDLGKTFVKPKQVVINLYEEDQIIPYLYKAPTELGEFKNLFLHLGATTQASAYQYAVVLESLYNETLGDKLHPNELRLAFRAVQGLFNLLQKKKDEEIPGALYLPSSQGRLVPSTELVYNDEPSYAERIRHFDRSFLVHLSECGLKVDNFRDLVKLVPSASRPAMLTNLVQERLEPKSQDRLIVHGIAEKLRYQLNSKAFFQGILRLLRHEHRKSGHKVKGSVLQTLQQQLKRVHVYGADRLLTFLSYDDERIQGSESETQCFAEKRLEEETGQELWTICINSSIGLAEELLVSVAEVVNRIIGDILSHSVHYIQPILTCAPHSISRVLDKMKVRPDHSVDIHHTTLPPPGSFIPIEDHHLLKEDFENYEQGEYVGFELDDDETGGRLMIYAVIIENVKQESQEGENDESGKKFTQQYRINVGEDRDTTLACVTDLYKFHRIEGLVSRSDSERTRSQGTSASTPRYRESFYERSSVFEPQSPKNKKKKPSTGDSASDHARVNASDHIRTNAEQPGLGEMKGDFGFNAQHTQPQDWQGENDAPNFGENDAYEGFASYQDRYFQKGGKQNGFAEDAHEARGNGEDERQLEEYQEENGDFRRKLPQEPPGEQSEEVKKQVDLMTEISDALEDAWKLPENQKKKVIKRLLLKWHPDKNIGEEEFATIITQHIHSELERLELGLPRPENFEDVTGQFAFDVRNPFSGSDSFKKNFYNAYQFFFEQMNQRAKEHKEQRERYKENFSREYSAQQGDYNFDVPPTFSSSNPQPAQAKRFLAQAQEDLRSADNDYEAKEPAFEWVCFKAHQAAEKAFKAAQFSVDAVTSFSHDLVTLAASVEDLELRRLAQRLQSIVGNSSKLYNPDPIDFVVIPHEEYNREMACDAVMCATDILERVKEFLENRE